MWGLAQWEENRKNGDTKGISVEFRGVAIFLGRFERKISHVPMNCINGFDDGLQRTTFCEWFEINGTRVEF